MASTNKDRSWIEVTTVGDLLDRAASSTDADAVVFPDVRATYPELSAATSRFARMLLGLGVKPGEKVGILMPNSLDYVIALLGAMKLGAIAVPVNGRFKRHELTQVIAHADVRVLVVAAGAVEATDYPRLITSAFPKIAECDSQGLELQEAPALKHVVDLGGASPGFLTRAELEQAGEGVAATEVDALQARVRVRDIALLMYTSGTTSKPKGCMLTHEAIVRQAANVALTKFLLTSEDVFWDPLPLFHCGGLIPMLGCFSVGAQYCHAGHFDPDVALEMLQRERCTVAYPAFDTIWTGILNHPRLKDADLSSLRLIQSIVTPERLAQYEAIMPWAAQVSSYGSTESATNLTLSRPDDPYEVRMHTLGTPVEGMEIKIVDPESGSERPTGEVGELCFRGYALFEGYYKDPELTAASIDRDGWFHTGDLGEVDEEGRFVYAGRLKDMLKVGGENVSALEVEDYLSRHPAIDIVQVVAAPDARYQEVPAAFVQLKPKASASEQEIIAFCVGQIATFKVPRYVRFVTEWPMSGTKIQKFQLREQITKELERAGISEAPRVDVALKS